MKSPLGGESSFLGLSGGGGGLLLEEEEEEEAFPRGEGS